MQDIIAKLTAKDDKYACAIADKIISEIWDDGEKTQMLLNNLYIRIVEKIDIEQ